MLFNSLEYAIFLPAVFLVFWALGRLHLARTVFLLAASYLFYASWNPSYLLLMWGACTFDFLVARRMGIETRAGRRKALMLASVALNLGVLGVFKYFDFFADSTVAALRAAGVSAEPFHLDVLLPVGISFYTFQTMAYVIDVYRRDIEPTRSYLKYLLFISFFPQLVAGPIMRARDLLPQFDRAPLLREGESARGLFLIGVGLVKKVVVADFLAVNLVDRVFDYPDHFSSVEVLAGVYAYAIQIYCDFSGYSDIAIGSAILLGFRLTRNFDQPYLAVDLQDFWRRWHISLSTWLRDYLYIPLGGNRGSELATYRNLAITMLLGGLWHGASWNFVAWGALHGGALALTRAWQRFRARRKKVTGTFSGSRPVVTALSGVLTFHYVCLAWVFFRAEDLPAALGVLEQIGRGTTFVANLPGVVLAAIAAGYAGQFLPDRWQDRLALAWTRMPAPAQAAVMAAVLLGVHRVSIGQSVPFIYFQF